MAARLQKAVATSTQENTFSRNLAANAVASYASVISSSRCVNRPHFRGTSKTLETVSAGGLESRHSLGMRESRSDCFLDAMARYFGGAIRVSGESSLMHFELVETSHRGKACFG